MNRLERLYAINETIRRRAPRPVSAAVLAEDFGVSRRTIERDLASLRAAGMPLYGQRGRTGGQRTVDSVTGFDRSGAAVVTLTTPEVAALVIAIAAAGANMPFSEAGHSATNRLLDGLADTTRIAVEELRGRIRTVADPESSQPAGPRGNVGVRRTLEEAVRRGVVVNMEYLDRNDVATARSVEAVGFYQGGDGWYLIGWCQLRDAGRIFRVDRVTSARMTKTAIGDRDVDATLGWVPQSLASP